MKSIPLTRNQFALVDDEDFEFLSQWKWYCSAKGYAVRGTWVDKKVRHVWMHRAVNNTPDDMETDHKNSNKLDNRRNNLRTATHGQNTYNRLNARNSSGVKGVTWHKKGQKWMVQIFADGQHYYLGLFSSLDAAKVVYEEAAERLHSGFRKLN